MSSFQQQLLNQNFSNNDQSSITSRIVEFVVPEITLKQLAFIFPLLGHLSYSEDQRWVTCIGPLLLSKKDCLLFGLNRYRLLQVLPTQRCNMVDIAERALGAGKSHTVFCLLDTLTKPDLIKLEQAAALGHARCVIVRSR